MSEKGTIPIDLYCFLLNLKYSDMLKFRRYGLPRFSDVFSAKAIKRLKN